MPHPSTLVIVLAGGEGRRMGSSNRPKVLHGFAGRTLLGHVLEATRALEASRTLVVVGHRRAEVVQHLADIAPYAEPVVQDEQRGTRHAVDLAMAALSDAEAGIVVVIPGDMPLLTGDVLTDLVSRHAASGAAATLLTSGVADPTGFTRVVRASHGSVARVVGPADAGPDHLMVGEVAASLCAFDLSALRESLATPASTTGEEYLDIVASLVSTGQHVAVSVAPAEAIVDVDDRVQLAAAHRAYNERLIERHMRAGVTVVDPGTTWIDADVTIEPDSVLWPGVQLHGATHVAKGASVGPQVVLTDSAVGPCAQVSWTVATQATIGPSATVGPFAHLRPGTNIAADAHIGGFVELKNAEVGEGTKVPHLAYVGDATIGEHSNIGGGTIFANYDGVNKHRTVVGRHARTGSANAFVAPVTIGDGAYTAAGSIITRDVPPGAMGVARAPQRNVAGWVARMRPGTPAAEAALRAAAGDGSSNSGDADR